MKTVLISIRPPHTDNIFNRTKVIEWRKTMLPLGHYYCYESGKYGKKKVIGEFDITCRNGYGLKELENRDDIVDSGKVELDWLKEYAGNRTFLWANFISNAKLYDKPKELSEFRKPCIMAEMPYCPSCKYGIVQYSSDEVECSADLKGACSDWLCCNRVTRPPQSWMYVEEEVWTTKQQT